MFDKRKLTRMGRRRFISTLSTLGVSSEAARRLTQSEFDALVDDPKQEVPRLGYHRHTNHSAVESGREPQRTGVFYTISRDDWRETEAAYRAVKRLNNRFSDPLVRSGLTRDESTGRPGVKVDYEVHLDATGEVKREPDVPADEVRKNVPTEVTERVSRAGKTHSVENIPVEFVETRRTPQSDPDSYFDRTIRPVPGGCEAGTNVSTTSDAWTLGAPAFDKEKVETVLLTARHCINEKSGSPVYQNGNKEANKIGYSDKYTVSGTGDAATIRVGDDNVEYAIAAADDATDEYAVNVYGTVSKTRCKDLVAGNDTVYQQGRRTGRTQCQVVDFKPPSDTVGDDYKIEVGANTDGGDSGGPYYEEREDDVDNTTEAYILGIHSRGAYDENNEEKNGVGNCMFWIEDEFSLSV